MSNNDISFFRHSNYLLVFTSSYYAFVTIHMLRPVYARHGVNSNTSFFVIRLVEVNCNKFILVSQHFIVIFIHIVFIRYYYNFTFLELYQLFLLHFCTIYSLSSGYSQSASLLAHNQLKKRHRQGNEIISIISISVSFYTM